MESCIIYKPIIKMVFLLMVYGSIDENVTEWREDACGIHGACDCSTYKGIKIVDCRNKNLRALPSGIMADVDIINLSRNKISELKPDSFVRQRVLRSLDISYNRIRDLPKDLLSNTTRLTKLCLSNNEITKLDKEFLSTILNLEILDLRSNRIKHLTPNTFVRQGVLQELDISYNRLQYLPKDLLYNTTGLTNLYLSNNGIMKLDKDFLSTLLNLEMLDLSFNKLTKLDKDLFSSLVNLRILILSNNNLETIAESLFSSLINLEMLNLDFNDLNMTSFNFIENLKNLKKFFIRENKIKQMTQKSLQNIRNLGVFCVADNGMLIQSTGFMSSLTKLQMLWLSGNTILEVPAESFANFSSMQVLRLANSTLKDIPDQLLFSMYILKELDLSDNILQEIRSPHFSTLQKLEELILSHNRIQKIQKGSFKSLTNLHKIDLRNNKISSLPEYLFTHSNLLKYIHLEGNDLVALPSNLFGHSSLLEELYLSDNKIQTVPESSIHNLPYLIKLDMSGNYIEELAEKTFGNLTGLMFLSLNRNRLTNLPPMIFAPLVNLECLELNDNSLHELSNQQFVKLRKIVVLHLQGNRIQKVPKNLLISQRQIRSLSMAYNAIDEVPEDMLAAIPFVSDVNLSSNNLTVLPHNCLGSVRKIKTMQFSQNHIEELRKENFGKLAEVENFYVSHNKLSYLPEDLFSEVVISGTLDFSNNRLTKLTIGLFDSNNRTHGLQTLLLQRNLLTYLPANILSGLKNLKSLSLFYNNIQHLEDDTFAGTGVEQIFLFGNNLSVLDGAPFNNEDIKEIHLYGNEVDHLNGASFTGLDKTTEVYINCEELQNVQRADNNIICVTPQYVPTLRVNRELMGPLENEGFTCNDLQVISECSPCPRGTYGDGRHCIPCPPGGFYQDEIGTSQQTNGVCKRCHNGTYVTNGGAVSIAECVVCPDGTKKDTHAGYRACFCLDNYSRVYRFGPCFECQQEEGVTCLGDYKSISSGYYWNWNFQNADLSKYERFVNNLKTENGSFDTNTKYNEQMPRAHKCPRRESCKNTPGDIEATCSEGYRGWLCNKCEASFYSVMNYCLPCPDAIVLIIEVLLVIVFCLAVYIVILQRNKGKKSRRQNNRSVVDIVISRAKIALGFYQVVGEFFSSLHYVNWAGALRYVGELISYIELNIFRIFIRPQCFHEKFLMNPKLEFIIGMIFIGTVLIFSLLLYQAMKIRYILRARATVGARTINNYTKPLKSKIITCVIILLFATYPPICTMIFQLYPQACETFCFDVTNRECITVLRSDYDLNCNDLRIYNAFAYFATIGYVLAFPCALFLWLRVIFRSRVPPEQHASHSASNEAENKMRNLTEDDYKDKEKNPMWVDFLCENYKPQYWYWEIVELARKVTQTFVITLVGWEDKLTVLVTIGISVLFLTLHARFMPMKSSYEQYLQMFSLTAILVNVLIAAMGIPDEYEGALSHALVVLNVVVITIIAGEIVVGLLIRLKHLRIHKAISRCCVLMKVRAVSDYRRMKNSLSHENQVCKDESSNSFTE